MLLRLFGWLVIKISILNICKLKLSVAMSTTFFHIFWTKQISDIWGVFSLKMNILNKILEFCLFPVRFRISRLNRYCFGSLHLFGSLGFFLYVFLVTIIFWIKKKINSVLMTKWNPWTNRRGAEFEPPRSWPPGGDGVLSFIFKVC